MSWQNWLQIGALVGLIGVTAPLLGAYLARVYGGGPSPGDRIFGPLERLCYRLAGIDERGEQTWRVYAGSLLIFSGICVAAVYLLMRLQGSLPFNPSHAVSAGPALAFNTAVSFATNTNWQNYAGETGASHLTQMAGLAVQNFLSAAVGIAVAIALVRGLTRRKSDTIGNFWVDLVRTTVRVLLPIAIVLAIALASQGVIQNLH
ncbi:MAG TPA: potassium-transporting ATPase subunit KdpA, partial [Candidatus Limnocylindrales bacterium]